MFKYGLYLKVDLKLRSFEDKKKDFCFSRISLGVKEIISDENRFERMLLFMIVEKVCLEDKNMCNLIDYLKRVIFKESVLFNYNFSFELLWEVNNILCNVNELKKLVVERFREFKWKNGFCNDVLEFFLGVREVISIKCLMEDILSENKERKKNMDLRSFEGDFFKCWVFDEVNFKVLVFEGEIIVFVSIDGVVLDFLNWKKGVFFLKGIFRVIFCVN